MRPVVIGQPIVQTGNDRAWKQWVEVSLKAIEEASYVPDTRSSELTATGLFVAFCANEEYR